MRYTVLLCACLATACAPLKNTSTTSSLTAGPSHTLGAGRVDKTADFMTASWKIDSANGTFTMKAGVDGKESSNLDFEVYAILRDSSEELLSHNSFGKVAHGVGQYTQILGDPVYVAYRIEATAYTPEGVKGKARAWVWSPDYTPKFSANSR